MDPVRGHHASSPFSIPKKGWWAILKRAWADVGRDHVSLVAAGVAFYGLLALFPAITALIALAGLVVQPSEISQQIETFASMLPQRAAEIVTQQAVQVAGAQDSGLGLAAALGLALAIYSASKGVASLIEGLNIAYDEREKRGFIHLTLLKLGLTIFLVVGMAAGLGATIVLPSILSIINLGSTTEMLIGLARWAVLIILSIFGIAVLYRFAPSRSRPRWRWITPGALLACVLWVIASIGFAYYAENFGSYNESFGTLAGAIVLLMWLWISAYVLLFGAEINSEAELQTFEDTTIGKDQPMGKRGAVKADNPPPDANSDAGAAEA